MPQTSATARRGLIVRARWQDRCVWSQVLRPGGRESVAVGSGPGCDFALSSASVGTSALELASLGAEGPRVRFTRAMRGTLHASSGPVALDSAGEVALERGERVELEAGPITFEVREVALPPQLPAAPFAGLDWAFLDLVALLLAVLGVAVVGAATQVDDGPGDDAALGRQAQLLKRVVHQALRVPSAPSAAMPKRSPKKEAAPSRLPLASRPSAPRNGASAPSARGLLQGVFAPQGALGNVLGKGGLGEALQAAGQGVRVAESGAGGWALRDSGAGGPGGRLEGIGVLPTRGKGGGHQGYGGHAVCEGAECRKAELTPEPRADEAVVGCAIAGACLDKELIRKVIRANLGGIRACYQYELTQHPELSGTVAVKFLISTGGGVTASEVARSTTSSASLDQCVANRVRALRFPSVRAQGMATAVTYPFHFQPAGR